MKNAQDAIKQAIDAGYNPITETQCNYPYLDPLFWAALGKARNWSIDDDLSVRAANWFNYAIRYCDTRLSGGDEEKFWESLP